MSPDKLEGLAAALIDALAARGRRVATAESCTGGWIAKCLTDIAGSSRAFGCGIVSYSNEAKRTLLNVSASTLDKHGAVSEAVVREMASGVLAASGADLAVAVSGIAGPDGGSDDKPVGTVWFAWGLRQGDAIDMAVQRECFAGDRDSVRRQTVALALAGCLERVQGDG